MVTLVRHDNRKQDKDVDSTFILSAFQLILLRLKVKETELGYALFYSLTLPIS